MPEDPKTTHRPELLFGLVSQAGSPLPNLEQELKNTLRAHGYEIVDIRLSKLRERFKTGWKSPADAFEDTRIAHLQTIGNAFRTALRDGAALARAALVAIREARLSRPGGAPTTPLNATAFILNQLKHPAEVDLLRSVYDSAFYLIAGHAPYETRRKWLADEIARSHKKAGAGNEYIGDSNKVILDDEKQLDQYGQNTRDTYPKSDMFIDLGIPGGEYELQRFIDLVFGHPFHSPTKSEYVMHQAFAASLRSSDEARQVGAVIARDADVVAVGTNEIPFRGGGLWWPGPSPDMRDQALVRRGDDRARQIKITVLAELLDRIRSVNWLAPDKAPRSGNELADELLPSLKGSHFMNIGEFGRTVHAEMAALIDAARRGVQVDQHVMHVTTFPCHNCAKHLIAAGIKNVLYLEPYPKSRAGHLHGEEISLDPILEEDVEKRVVFKPFSGIAPRQYSRLFAMTRRGAINGLSLTDWNNSKGHLSPRYVVRNASSGYIAAEAEELRKLPPADFDWDPTKVAPDH